VASTLNKPANNPCELTQSYSVESGNEVEMSKHEIMQMIQRDVFDPVERDTVYNLSRKG
jgi:2-iminoacetate synthase ThiH